ncbi:MAG: hypothetical protein GF331_18475, partial [Chitinivibrionales bacterium]|nr:hypothetical protein [Chitinivibrionales bacterium]
MTVNAAQRAHKPRIGAGVCLALIALLPVCVGCGKSKQDLPVGEDSVVVPYQEFDKATLYSYEGKHRKWRLQSLY